MELVHCIYCSTASQSDFAEPDMAALLVECRENNAGIGVTGMLLFQEGSFFQVLEGDRDVVDELFEKIAADLRHRRVVKLIMEPIAERSFAEWSMGHPGITRKQLATIAGLNDFFGRGRAFHELGAGRAKTLLQAFRQGKKWRSLLS